jgi:hypothetical protein
MSQGTQTKSDTYLKNNPKNAERAGGIVQVVK